MTVYTAQPPAMAPYIPPDIKREFKRLLDNIATSDVMHSVNTPSSTLLLILAAARNLGVPPEELVSKVTAS